MPDREATYFYCLLQARQTPRLGRAARGLPHTGRPRLLDAGQGLWLVVGDAPLGHYSGERIERKLSDLEWISACAMAHERVIEDAARSGTVIPMKLFTLFANDERALTHISRARRKLDKLLKRVADRAEWGVRLTLDENRARRGESARARRQASGLGAGTSFLVRKQQERQAAHRLVAEARAAARPRLRPMVGSGCCWTRPFSCAPAEPTGFGPPPGPRDGGWTVRVWRSCSAGHGRPTPSSPSRHENEARP